MSADEYAAWCVELLSGLGAASAKRLFGGHGLYLEGRMVGLIADERLYLKVDVHTRAAFEAAGGEPFVYSGKGRPITMSYWTPPDDALDGPDAMRPWARLALEAARRVPEKKPRRR